MKKMFKKHRKLCFTAGIILIVVLIAGVQFMRVRSRMAERMNVPQWETATLERRTLLDSISATGTITSIANKDVTANVTGVYVESVEVSVGDRVQEGDLLCVLNAETIEQNLADAKASYDVAKKKTQIELASAQRSLTETQTGNAINAERAQDNVSDAYNDYLETVTDIEEAESKWDQALETEYEKKGEYEYRQELLAAKKEEMEAAKIVADQTDSTAYESEFQSTKAGMEKYITDNALSFNGLLDHLYLSNDGLSDLTIDSFVSGDLATAHKEVLDGQLSVLKSLQSQYKKALADDQAYAAVQSACQALEQEVSSWKAKYDAAAQSTKSAQTAYEQALKTSESSKDSYEKQVENKEDTERSNASTLASKTDSLTTTQLNASIQGLSDEQKIAEYEKQIEACQVKAPFSGIITDVSVLKDDSYNGGVIVTIEDDSSYEVTAQIDEYDISKVEIGQSVVIKTNATGDTELAGTVKSVAPRATQGTSDVTYEVIVSIDEQNENLRMDMTAQMSIILSQATDVLTVPYEAVQEKEDGTFYIEVLMQDGKVSDTEPADLQNADKVFDKNRLPQEGMELPQRENDQEMPLQNMSLNPDQNGTMNQNTKQITVTKGVESDYYVEIAGEGLTEGMTVIIPQTQAEQMDMQNRMMMRGPMGGF